MLYLLLKGKKSEFKQNNTILAVGFESCHVVKLRRGLYNSYVNGSDACRDVWKGRM
jgi:hypothetical protein